MTTGMGRAAGAIMLRSFKIILASGLLLGSLGGCLTEVDPGDINNDDPQPDPQACSSQPWSGGFEIGTGEECFEAVTNKQSIPLIAGPQGGFHIWFGVRCANCDETQLLSYGVKDAETGAFVMVDAFETMIHLEPADGYRHKAGIQAYMPGVSWEGDPEYLGKSFVLWMQASVDGQIVEDEVTVVVDSVKYWSPPCDPNQENVPGGNGCGDGFY